MEPDQGRSAKRRRIGTACQSCRSAKARCEVQQDASICHRCHVLDIDCELPRRVSAPVSTHNNDIDDRLKRVEELVARISEAVFPSSATPAIIHNAGSVDESNPRLDDGHADTLISHNYPKPVEILQDLQDELYDQSRPSLERPRSLDIVSIGLVTPETAIQLLQTSVERFGKWISLFDVNKLSKDFAKNCPFLMSVLCLLAARFHSEVSLHTVQEMYGHVKRLTADVMIETLPTGTGIVQGLTLLCMFSPTVRTDSPLDSWHLSGSTASHAIVTFNLGRPQGVSHEKATERLRVWGSICLTHLQYSIGSGRPFCISTPLVEECRSLLKIAGTPVADETLVAEITLYLSLYRALRHQATDKSNDAPLKSWHTVWGHHLDTSGPPSTLKLSHWFAHLLQHRLNSVTSSHHHPQPQNPYHSENIPAWRESANIVSQFIRHDPARVSDLPDFMFFIASYAALVLCESALDHHLVENLQTYFFKVACGETHIAHRHGRILQRALQISKGKGEDGGGNRSTEDNENQARVLSETGEATFMGLPQAELGDFDALAGFDIFGEYFTVGSLL